MEEIRIPKYVWIILALLYWVAPDLLPGPIDDILVMLYAITRQNNEYIEY